MALIGSIETFKDGVWETVGTFRADKSGVTVRMTSKRLQRLVEKSMHKEVAAGAAPPKKIPRSLRGYIGEWKTFGKAIDSTEDNMAFFVEMLSGLDMYLADQREE